MDTSTNRLAKAPVGKLLFTLAIPNIFAQLVNMLYNIIDRIYIGRIPNVGADALTGVGVGFPIFMIIMAFSSLVGMGGAPQAAIKLGEGKQDEAERILGNSVALLIGLSVTLMTVFLIFGKDLLFLFGASNQTIDYAWDYIKIVIIGAITIQFALGLNPYIATQGFAKYSMLTVLIGAILNIILDPILIFGFDMGVQGAAIATVFSQGVSALWVLKFLTGKKSTLKIRPKYIRLKKSYVILILSLGISPFIMQSTESLLNITFNTSLQQYGGDLNVGAMTITASLMQMLMLPLMGLTQGAQPIISYNFGANNFDRVKQAFKYLFISSIAYSALFWLAVQFFPRVFIALFTTDPALVEVTANNMRVYMAVVLIFGAQIACQQTFIALGQARKSLFLALLRKIILLIPLILILPLFFTNKVFGVLVAEPIADFIAVAVTVIIFFTNFEKILTEKKIKSQST